MTAEPPPIGTIHWGFHSTPDDPRFTKEGGDCAASNREDAERIVAESPDTRWLVAKRVVGYQPIWSQYERVEDEGTRYDPDVPDVAAQRRRDEVAQRRRDAIEKHLATLPRVVRLGFHRATGDRPEELAETCDGRDPAYPGTCPMRRGHPGGCFGDVDVDA